ncbi:hypothetical protein VOLCADRAFT_97386 [Volvox carteri f. nagariensis]|uniref:Uncharacterized protein n=1 Tax=Volvox carteri f. nagariensis TaxID=3068 RepID=D8UCM1_VOLCA|nr:uncharacterized protein VOLCADRAFT_97386 [Volvox carteri f. nagariensis]EFJ42516.1 hypothetical protein VOLCADRAFT_97386 [Volvox carteri f. nagariensis]|eukprot:XP_002956372.1 hypothetical protein VOLCADRAFT_97386 [Volvox carteri f. nagariensis]
MAYHNYLGAQLHHPPAHQSHLRRHHWHCAADAAAAMDPQPQPKAQAAPATDKDQFRAKGAGRRQKAARCSLVLADDDGDEDYDPEGGSRSSSDEDEPTLDADTPEKLHCQVWPQSLRVDQKERAVRERRCLTLQKNTAKPPTGRAPAALHAAHDETARPHPKPQATQCLGCHETQTSAPAPGGDPPLAEPSLGLSAEQVKGDPGGN